MEIRKCKTQCPYYTYQNGHFTCLKLDNTRANYLSGSDLDRYCWTDNYRACPYFKR